MTRVKRGLLITAVLTLGVLQTVQILTPSVNAAVFTPPWQAGSVTDIKSGNDFSCVIASADVYCWGDNAAGQLGDGTTTDRSSPVKVIGLPEGKTPTDLTLGVATICALVDGSAYCWGSNQAGALGNDSTVNSSTPVKVAGLLDGKNVTQISIGQNAQYVCAVADGSAYCWGEDSFGRLGNIESSSTVPTRVVGVLADKTNVTQIFTGSSHACALAGAAAYCWGSNFTGEVGNGTNGNIVNAPVAVDASDALAGKQIIKLAIGASRSCALSSDGSVYCWGANSLGQLGNGTTTSVINVPTRVTGLLLNKNVTQLSAKGEFTCAIANGAGYCWGPDQHDDLGNGNAPSGNLPVAVDASGVLQGKTLTSIVAPPNTAYAIADGRAYAWGSNQLGRLGDGSDVEGVSAPVAVDTSGVLANKTVTKIATAENFTCVLASGDVYCWGYNFGRLGNDSTATSSVPVVVGKRLAVTSVSSSEMNYAPGATMESYVIGEGFTDDTVVKYGDQVVPVVEVTNTMLTVTVTAPAGLTATTAVDVSVTNPGTATDTLSHAFTYNVAPPKIVSGVEFIQDQDKTIMNVNGSSYYKGDGSEVNDAIFGVFTVSLNDQSILPCAGGLLLTVLQSTPGTVYTTEQPCYFVYSFNVDQQLMSSSQIKIWLPDTFDVTEPGTVSVNGSNVYSFNAPVDNNPVDEGGEMPQPTTPPAPAAILTPPSLATILRSPLIAAVIVAQSQTPVDEAPTVPIVSVDQKGIDGIPVISSLPVFRGKAAPYSTVVVTVHSDPVTCTTKADSEGNWECQLSDKLPAGSHTVKIAMTSPDNQTTHLGPYPVQVAAVASVQTDTEPLSVAQGEQKNSPPLWVIIGAAVGVTIIALVVISVARRRKA
ncbi:MAG TPA: Ig-like domain-containing protein [Candidatus Saccharimonadales bacterium]